VPRASLGAGLGCWVDAKTNGTWSTAAASAEARVCALMNASVVELDMFLLEQSGKPHTPGKGWLFADAPEPFWIAQLERFMGGGGCVPTLAPTLVCPTASVGPASSWRAADDPTCCESDGRRPFPTGVPCNVSCAKAECAAAGMKWKEENLDIHPYECCHKLLYV
jgi:hypothetical protein